MVGLSPEPHGAVPPTATKLCGAVVKPVSERETFRVDIRSLGKDGNFADLFELRGILEIEAAGLAALRRTDADLEEMAAAVGELQGRTRFDERRLEADASFHRAVGKAAGNSYLFGIICYISARLKETARATSDVYTKDDLVELTMGEHRKVFEAIEASDQVRARSAMAVHIRAAAARLNVPSKSGS